MAQNSHSITDTDADLTRSSITEPVTDSTGATVDPIAFGVMPRDGKFWMTRQREKAAPHRALLLAARVRGIILII